MTGPIRPIALGPYRDDEGRFLVERASTGFATSTICAESAAAASSGNEASKRCTATGPMACYPPGLVDLCAQLGVEVHSSAS